MKKLICIILCLCTLLAFVGCKEDSNLSGKISNKVDFKLHKHKEIWLDNSHIEKIELKTDENGRKAIIFTATAKGKEILFNKSSENIGAILSLSADEYLIDSPTIMEPIEDGIFTFMQKYSDMRYVFNYLTGEEDIMKGVNPPDYLISEQDAKEKVLTATGISANDATKVVINLIIDDDYFGWKYTVSFTAKGGKYRVEVNAYNGAILNFE
ncbi:MAG: PepSY domain-containing protein [Clostridia bacterium]|nr:PepSY domain-containing protein [Clostridia bacterium]